jgi:glucuronate isomerase
MNPERFISPDSTTRNLTYVPYKQTATLPIISRHGHDDSRLFSDPYAPFGSRADLFFTPAHNGTRRLYPHEISRAPLMEDDHLKIWRIFCENLHLFHGTPGGIRSTSELASIFGVDEKTSASNADRLLNTVCEKFTSPEFPRATSLSPSTSLSLPPPTRQQQDSHYAYRQRQ